MCKAMEKSLFGKLQNGEDVFAYTISSGNLTAKILNYGGTIQSLRYDDKEVVLGYDTIEEYVNNDGYFGATVGRYAGRIGDATFKLNGKRYRLEKNDGESCLHGGKVGFDKVLWNVDEENGVGDDFVEMTYLSADGEGGFPGNLSVKVRFYIENNGLGIRYFAKTDKDTYINLTNHTYFNLLHTRSIDFSLLKLEADEYFEAGEKLVPTGEKKSVKGTPFDFKWATPINDWIDLEDKQIEIAGGYDHNFVINGKGFRKFAELTTTVSGLKMVGFTDRPCVQFYSGNFITTRKVSGGEMIGKRSAICLETQGYPNSMNVGDAKADLLKAGETYESVTEYRFKELDKVLES